MLKAENLKITQVSPRMYSVDDGRQTITTRRTREEAEAVIEEIRNRLMAYHVACGRDVSDIENYIGGVAEVITVRTRPNGRVVAVIMCEAANSNWITGRLASGLMGGQRYDSQEDAEEAAESLASLP